MYQAPVIALLIGLSAIYNSVGQSLERKGWRIPLFMHHYGFMYAMLTILFIMGCQSMYYDVMVPSNWLDNHTTEEFVRAVMTTNGDLSSYDTWRDESNLDGFNGLKEFSMLCPLWTALTLLVCIYHTHEHINKIRENRSDEAGGEVTKGLLCNCPQHNQTLTVLVLPAVYGLLSFKSSCRMWMVMINHVPVPGAHHNISAVSFQNYDERKNFLLEMYDANFMVGDIYETIALVTFGNLVMGVLKKKIDHMKLIFEQETSDRADGEEMKQYIERLVASMRTLTVAGVKLFAMSCLLQGIYTIIITTMAFDFPGVGDHYFSRNSDKPGLFQTESVKASAHMFFLGAGFVASFAAIGNIMIIEEDFEELLEEFKPSFKFWGTKILVSLAFLQSILISLFLTPRGWSEIQSNLFYSSCLCLECLLIAIFHIKGWNANEVWYGDIENYEKPAGMKEPLLANKNPGIPDENK